MTLVGKISRLGPLKYTPSGEPIREFLLAVPQTTLGKDSIGYFDLLLFGEIAEFQTESLRIGTSLEVQGALWMRAYRNRKGQKISEVKIVVESLKAT